LRRTRSRRAEVELRAESRRPINCSSVGKLACLDQPPRSERIATCCATRTLISSIFSPLSFFIFVVRELKLFPAPLLTNSTRSLRTFQRWRVQLPCRVCRTSRRPLLVAKPKAAADSRNGRQPPPPIHQCHSLTSPRLTSTARTPVQCLSSLITAVRECESAAGRAKDIQTRRSCDP